MSIANPGQPEPWSSACIFLSNDRSLLLNALDKEFVESYFGISRQFAEDIFQQKDLMEIHMNISIIFASQTNVDIALAEDGLELILVHTSYIDSNC